MAPSPDAGSLPLLLMIMKLVCVATYDIVWQPTISYTIYSNVRHRTSRSHRIRYRMSNLRYRIRFRVFIRYRRWEDCSCQSDDRRLRRRIRLGYRRFSYDVVYDVVAPHQVDTTFDVVFTTDAISYDIAITYDMACLALWERPERRRVALAMSPPRSLLLPLDPRPCQMV